MEKSLRFLIVIPARYASTRFPGKPLADINGQSMVQRVFVQAGLAGVAQKIVVATDDERIYSHVNDFGGNVVMTSPDHASGTDRCREALEKTEGTFDVVINLQGDEPFIKPEQLTQLASCFSDENCKIATLVKRTVNKEEIESPNVVKVVKDSDDYALYFSRSPIPYNREAKNTPVYFKHIGLYAYRADTLKAISLLPPSSLELGESLEQLRWLENGYKIKVAETELESMAVDTPADLERVKKHYF